MNILKLLLSFLAFLSLVEAFGFRDALNAVGITTVMGFVSWSVLREPGPYFASFKEPEPATLPRIYGASLVPSVTIFEPPQPTCTAIADPFLRPNFGFDPFRSAPHPDSYNICIPQPSYFEQSSKDLEYNGLLAVSEFVSRCFLSFGSLQGKKYLHQWRLVSALLLVGLVLWYRQDRLARTARSLDIGGVWQRACFNFLDSLTACCYLFGNKSYAFGHTLKVTTIISWPYMCSAYCWFCEYHRIRIENARVSTIRFSRWVAEVWGPHWKELCQGWARTVKLAAADRDIIYNLRDGLGFTDDKVKFCSASIIEDRKETKAGLNGLKNDIGWVRADVRGLKDKNKQVQDDAHSNSMIARQLREEFDAIIPRYQARDHEDYVKTVKTVAETTVSQQVSRLEKKHNCLAKDVAMQSKRAEQLTQQPSTDDVEQQVHQQVQWMHEQFEEQIKETRERFERRLREQSKATDKRVDDMKAELTIMHQQLVHRPKEEDGDLKRVRETEDRVTLAADHQDVSHEMEQMRQLLDTMAKQEDVKAFFQNFLKLWSYVSDFAQAYGFDRDLWKAGMASAQGQINTEAGGLEAAEPQQKRVNLQTTAVEVVSAQEHDAKAPGKAQESSQSPIPYDPSSPIPPDRSPSKAPTADHRVPSHTEVTWPEKPPVIKLNITAPGPSITAPTTIATVPPSEKATPTTSNAVAKPQDPAWARTLFDAAFPGDQYEAIRTKADIPAYTADFGINAGLNHPLNQLLRAFVDSISAQHISLDKEPKCLELAEILSSPECLQLLQGRHIQVLTGDPQYQTALISIVAAIWARKNLPNLCILIGYLQVREEQRSTSHENARNSDSVITTFSRAEFDQQAADSRIVVWLYNRQLRDSPSEGRCWEGLKPPDEPESDDETKAEPVATPIVPEHIPSTDSAQPPASQPPNHDPASNASPSQPTQTKKSDAHDAWAWKLFLQTYKDGEAEIIPTDGADSQCGFVAFCLSLEENHSMEGAATLKDMQTTFNDKPVQDVMTEFHQLNKGNYGADQISRTAAEWARKSAIHADIFVGWATKDRAGVETAFTQEDHETSKNGPRQTIVVWLYNNNNRADLLSQGFDIGNEHDNIVQNHWSGLARPFQSAERRDWITVQPPTSVLKQGDAPATTLPKPVKERGESVAPPKALAEQTNNDNIMQGPGSSPNVVHPNTLATIPQQHNSPARRNDRIPDTDQKYFEEAFPTGATAIGNQYDGVKCALQAVVDSMTHQHPELPTPSVQELFDAFDSESHGSYVLYQESLFGALETWAWESHEIMDISLGVRYEYDRDEFDYFILPPDGIKDPVHVVWVQDNDLDDEQKVWSGLQQRHIKTLKSRKTQQKVTRNMPAPENPVPASAHAPKPDPVPTQAQPSSSSLPSKLRSVAQLDQNIPRTASTPCAATVLPQQAEEGIIERFMRLEKERQASEQRQTKEPQSLIVPPPRLAEIEVQDEFLLRVPHVKRRLPTSHELARRKVVKAKADERVKRKHRKAEKTRQRTKEKAKANERVKRRHRKAKKTQQRTKKKRQRRAKDQKQRLAREESQHIAEEQWRANMAEASRRDQVERFTAEEQQRLAYEQEQQRLAYEQEQQQAVEREQQRQEDLQPQPQQIAKEHEIQQQNFAAVLAGVSADMTPRPATIKDDKWWAKQQSRSSDSKQRFDRRFPLGVEIVKVDGEWGTWSRALNALVFSLAHQYPNLPRPTVEELLSMLSEKLMKQLQAKSEQSNFTVTSLDWIWKRWAEAHKVKVWLGAQDEHGSLYRIVLDILGGGSESSSSFFSKYATTDKVVWVRTSTLEYTGDCFGLRRKYPDVPILKEQKADALFAQMFPNGAEPIFNECVDRINAFHALIQSILDQNVIKEGRVPTVAELEAKHNGLGGHSGKNISVDILARVLTVWNRIYRKKDQDRYLGCVTEDGTIVHAPEGVLNPDQFVLIHLEPCKRYAALRRKQVKPEERKKKQLRTPRFGQKKHNAKSSYTKDDGDADLKRLGIDERDSDDDISDAPESEGEGNGGRTNGQQQGPTTGAPGLSNSTKFPNTPAFDFAFTGTDSLGTFPKPRVEQSIPTSIPGFSQAKFRSTCEDANDRDAGEMPNVSGPPLFSQVGLDPVSRPGSEHEPQDSHQKRAKTSIRQQGLREAASQGKEYAAEKIAVGKSRIEVPKCQLRPQITEALDPHLNEHTGFSNPSIGGSPRPGEERKDFLPSPVHSEIESEASDDIGRGLRTATRSLAQGNGSLPLWAQANDLNQPAPMPTLVQSHGPYEFMLPQLPPSPSMQPFVVSQDNQGSISGSFRNDVAMETLTNDDFMELWDQTMQPDPATLTVDPRFLTNDWGGFHGNAATPTPLSASATQLEELDPFTQQQVTAALNDIWDTHRKSQAGNTTGTPAPAQPDMMELQSPYLPWQAPVTLTDDGDIELDDFEKDVEQFEGRW